MNGLIITGGSIEDAFALSYINAGGFDRMIAVDGGLELLKRLGLRPDIIVGDFDSVNQKVLSYFLADKTIRVERHQPEKDETDTELALSVAIAEKWDSIHIIGAIGSRLDHTMANIHIMVRPLRLGIPCRLADAKNRIYLIEKGHTFLKSETFGHYISFLSLTGEVAGISLTGFKYPLRDKTLDIASSLCISNELVAAEGTITFGDGILICMETMD